MADKPKPTKTEPKLLKIRGIAAVNRNGDYRLLASNEYKTDAQLLEFLCSREYWSVEDGEFIAFFETTIKVTFPPAIKVKIPPLVLSVSENINEAESVVSEVKDK